ncbi:hypothetical protein ARMGADRAFT_974392 [Armillaria gallica]|uniref:Peptidase C14 caspase domain-containing protein n=1 Tax=Armillaria gallica TaxID=47427 RepID=A0A2H3D7F2_ARMGA|nr:hypothetical protein ARMGADRAFT_974392 [Armillaria gallica]
MGQVLSAIRSYLSAIVSNDLSTGNGQTTQVATDGDAPDPRQTSAPVRSNNTENDVTPSEQHPSRNSARQVSVGTGTPSQGKHQTFALVIGIDKYKSLDRTQYLQGAVQDADDFESYLLKDRGVPKENITNLRDGGATRSDIIAAFIKLKDDPRITPGEVAIIIYFAGHGAVAHKPSAWKNWETPGDKVEMLCPADINPGIKGKGKVEGIPDRTLSRLILDLSKAKGNNITLILDCCHAAGMNRGSNNSSLRLRARTLKSIQDLSPTCDEHIYSQESLTRSVREGVSYFGSHVLLAACKRTQIAWEDGNNGIFTTALLRSLRNVASSDLQPTYDSLMNGLPPMRGGQTPHWGGKHLHRFIFDSWRVPASRSMILCYHGNRGSPWRSDLVLQAGLLHGITTDSTFEIFESSFPHPNIQGPITTLTVKEVKPSISRLELPSSDPTLFPLNSGSFWYARLRKTFDNSPLHIYCNDQGTLDLILVDTPESWLTAHVIPVEDPDDADICLTVEASIVHFRAGARIEFSSYFPPYSPYPVHAMPDIRDFINRYAHFTSRLIIKSPAATTDFVDIEMNKLRFDADEGEIKKDSQVTLTTVEDDELFEIVVDKSIPAHYRDPYGFTIRRNGSVDLYAYLLYFNVSKLTIDTWYHPQKSQMNGGGSVDPCLPNNSTPLTLGYGRFSMDPMSFNVPADRNVDVSFIKILVATKAVDIGPIKQFESSHADGKERSIDHWTPPPSDIKWASKKFTIISKCYQNVDSLQVAKENALSNSE